MIDIQKIKNRMLVKYPSFGSVISGVKYKENPSIDTAATDGETIYYNSEFLEQLTELEQLFVMAHEVCHIAFNHILRSEGKDTYLWNIATDAVINQLLKQDKLSIIEGGVDIPEAIKYDAEQLYDKLLEEKKQKENEEKDNDSDGLENENSEQDSSQSTGQGSDKDNNQEPEEKETQSRSGSDQESEEKEDEPSEEQEQNVGHDSHDMWKEAVKKHKEGNNNKEKESDEESEEKSEEKNTVSEKDSFEENQEERKRRKEEFEQNLKKQAVQAGTSLGGSIRNVENIGVSKPIVDWRYVLKESINTDVDYRGEYVLEDGVVSSILSEYPVPSNTEIVLDTSGSINETLLKNFLRECKNILQHTNLKVGCFDTKFYGFHDIKTENDIENMQFEGYGGTDFNAAVNAFSDRAENKIIFTDGEAFMPDTPVNAIWIVFGDVEINPPGGRVIYVSQEDYEKLCSFDMNEQRSKTR